MRQLPAFEISDLIGNFDIDEDGNYIIVRNGTDKKGVPRLEDQDGKRVNRRGYFLNDEGYVVTRQGTIVFKPDEIDEDGEIPAPFCYLKNKETLAQGQNNGLPVGSYDVNGVVMEQDEEEEMIDRELNKLKN